MSACSNAQLFIVLSTCTLHSPSAHPVPVQTAAALHSLLGASPSTRRVLLACCRPELAVERVRAALQAHVGEVQRGGDEAEYEQEVVGRLASLLLALEAARGGADARSH
ncbi:unnamed protein product [Closterium sp. NIES-53]